jgi:nitroimidazol reductase NimA-like FMN-containing flavoprotein (pyridoxamine 5'-phosphate oxidase superfamily)
MNYKSIIGSGRLEIVENQEERKNGLATIMNHDARGVWRERSAANRCG